MIFRCFSHRSRVNEAIVLAIYRGIIGGARQPCFYSQFGVPDTPLGRYEMLSLHVFLTMYRLKSENETLRAISQEIADEFFKDIDDSLRELGIGDQKVPKHMKTLACMFYGRVGTYETALDEDNHVALATMLTRNVRPDLKKWPGAMPLALYILEAKACLETFGDDALIRGEIIFPDADRFVFCKNHEDVG